MSLVAAWPVTERVVQRAFDDFLRTPSARGMGWIAPLSPGGQHRDVKATRKLRDEAGEVIEKQVVEFKVPACFGPKSDEIALRAREEFKGVKRPRILRNLRAEALRAEEDIFAGCIEPAPKLATTCELFK